MTQKKATVNPQKKQSGREREERGSGSGCDWKGEEEVWGRGQP